MMTSSQQFTFARSVSFGGKGLHTGKHCNVTLHPSEPDSGILFRRTDKGHITIPATIEYARKLIRCSGLLKGGITVRTCEHLLAALYACGIDNALIKMDNEEVPIFDGSAAPLVKEVERAGAIVQNVPRKTVIPNEAIESRDGKRFVRIKPANELSIDLSLTLRRFSTLRWKGSLDRDTFKTDIASARTFAPLRHALPVKTLSCLPGTPIARGARLSNLLVYGRGKIWNPGGLRFENGLARHPVLDIIGDLMLTEKPVVEKITAFRSSHSPNQISSRKVLHRNRQPEQPLTDWDSI